MNYFKLKLLLSFIILNVTSGVLAQNTLPLENLDQFKAQAGNWMIVGDVTMDRHIDVHHTTETIEEAKKKRKRRKSDVVEEPKAVSFNEGIGILLNINDKEKRDQIITNWEHGDMELEFEVMLPKGSNSGIYLQGRYELQLFDSWGVKNPKFSDLGGIYENHSKDPATKLYGIPPESNASKAPGLWQKIKLHFQAPKFDNSGTKIQNARFVYVDINGVRIHTNAEVAMPTGGAIFKEEVSTGPIMIQGDHGPVAIRNIKYNLLEDSKIAIKDLTYKVYKGEYISIEDFINENPIIIGSTSKIDINQTTEEDNYAIIYNGLLVVRKEDVYTLSIGYSGGVQVELDGNIIIQDVSESSEAMKQKSLTLSAGTYPITIINFKKAVWRNPQLGFFIKGEHSNKKTFHEYSSYREEASTVSPIYVDAKAKPRLLRGFVSFNNDEPKLSHTIGVGMTDNINYIYDLNSANIIGVWRGDFADVTPMWYNRGNATFLPRGAVQWTFLNQPLAELSNLEIAFPEQADFDNFTPKGYKINKQSGLPVFKHIYKGVEVENSFEADESNTYIIHQVSFSKLGLANMYQKLASGTIKKMSDQSYLINDKAYYINVLSGQQPIVRDIQGVQELIVPVDGSIIRYEIIW